MDSIKRMWADLLQYSVAVAAVTAITLSALIFMLTVGIAVVIAKVIAFIR